MKSVKALLCVVTLSLVWGCMDLDRYQKEATFFGGDVTVTCSWYGYRSKRNDARFMAFQFNKAGTYKVTFSREYRGFYGDLPQDFVLQVTNAPLEYKSETRANRQNPQLVTITIERDGEKEVHYLR